MNNEPALNFLAKKNKQILLFIPKTTAFAPFYRISHELNFICATLLFH
jgi:hypothetical protein